MELVTVFYKYEIIVWNYIIACNTKSFGHIELKTLFRKLNFHKFSIIIFKDLK